MRHQNLWNESKDYIEEVEARGIVFNLIHGFKFETERPLVYLLPKRQAERFKNAVDANSDKYMCLLCDMYGSSDLRQVRSHVRHV